jgi:hypothetical protein
MVARKGGGGAGIPGRNVMILGEDLIRKRFVNLRKRTSVPYVKIKYTKINMNACRAE